MIIEDQRETKPAPGVIATKPTTAPEQAPTTEGLPIIIFSIIIQESIAAAAAVLVVIKALIATPALAPEKGYVGLVYGSGKLLLANLTAVVFTVIFTALVSWIIIKVIGLIMPIRVTDRAEAIGLDDSEHEETAYPTFLGLDS